MKKFLKALTPKRIIVGLIVIIILMQFFRIDKTNPEYDPANDFITSMNPPKEIADMLKVACYDCHSNETRYPWYTNIAPISWWIKDHINEGRRELNFSLWKTFNARRTNHKLEEGNEKVKNHDMPLKSYLIMHNDARLSDDQRKQLAAYFDSLRPPSAESEGEHDEGSQH